MALIPSLHFLTVCFAVLTLQSSSTALYSTPKLNHCSLKAISDLKEVIVKGLGFQAEEFRISGFDLRDAMVGQPVAYEFDVEIDNTVLPVKLLEDVNRWEYVDLPIFQVEDAVTSSRENGLVERDKPEKGSPVLAPFLLAGPMELWIQDAKDIKLSLPQDVDAGVLKKIVLADGAVVTVKGAKSVSLRHPVELPLPLNRTRHSFASGLLTLADRLRRASRIEGAPLLSLRIVGLTSLTAPSPSSLSSNNKLKLKRIAPGLVELSSSSKNKTIEAFSAIDVKAGASSLLTPDGFTTLWPLASINGSNSNLLGIERLLSSVLGPKADREGSFKLLKADVSSQTFVKISFGVEKKLKHGDGFDFVGFPAWRTKPEAVRMHFEVLAKVDGDKVVPERVMRVDPVVMQDTVASNVLLHNKTMSRTPIVHPPSKLFTL